MTPDIIQQQALAAITSGANVFLTGRAGTGKSTLTRTAMTELKAAGKNVAALAPTGVAAQNIGGATLHSFFGLPVGGVLDFASCNYLKTEKRRVIDATDVLVIDEISMVRADTFDAIEWTLKKNGCKPLRSFQWLLIGDMKQLPPVASDNDKAVLHDFYNGAEFYHSQAYQRLAFEEIELTHIHRQSDPNFIEALNAVRDGNKHPYFRRFAGKEPLGIVLAPHRETVERYNLAGLAAQDGPTYTFTAKIEGEAKLADFNFPARVEVKDGCKVMYLVNSQDDNRLVNGTMGIFREQEGQFYIEVKGVRYLLERYCQEKKKYVLTRGRHPVTGKLRDELKLEVVGSIEQMPIMLAYAITIHKSQGITLKEVTVDLTRPCFQKEQMYVALSRCSDPKGLAIVTK